MHPGRRAGEPAGGRAGKEADGRPRSVISGVAAAVNT